MTDSTFVASPAASIDNSAPVQEEDSERAVLEGFLLDTLNADAVRSLSRNTSGQVLSSSQGLISLSNGSGLTANVAYDLNTEQGIQYTWFTLNVDGLEFAAVPQVWYAEKLLQQNGSQRLSFIATDLLIGDVGGEFGFIASDDSAVSTGALRMEITIGSSGEVISSSMSLTPRT